MPNENEAIALKPKKKRSVLGCLLSLVAGLVLLVVLLVVFGVWFAGTDFPLKQAGDFVNKKSGGNLTFAENDTNFFAGRLHWKGVELTNPSRFTDKGFVKIDELKGEVALGSAIKTGLGMSDTIEVPEVIVSIGSVSLVGSDDWLKDNNAFDFKNAFAPAPTDQPTTQPQPDKPKTDQPAPTQQPAGPSKHVHIGKLTLKLGTIRALSHATTPGEKPRTIIDKNLNLSWEFTDVSDTNYQEKVVPVIKASLMKLGGDMADIGLALGAAAINDQLKGITGQANDAVKNTTGQATKAVDDVAKGVTGALDGLLGGKKKDAPKK